MATEMETSEAGHDDGGGEIGGTKGGGLRIWMPILPSRHVSAGLNEGYRRVCLKKLSRTNVPISV
jgi:hypothetical protein